MIHKPLRDSWLRPSGTFSELYDSHAGEAGVVLGGGPSLVDHLPTLPNGIWISANEHGVLLTQCKYCAFLDYTQVNPCVQGKATRLTFYEEYADYWITPRFNCGHSSLLAAWCLHKMGCDPIILAGMDCYGQAGTYWHDKDAYSTGNSNTVRGHVRNWAQLSMRWLPRVKLYTAPGPLAEIFPLYQ